LCKHFDFKILGVQDPFSRPLNDAPGTVIDGQHSQQQSHALTAAAVDCKHNDALTFCDSCDVYSLTRYDMIGLHYNIGCLTCVKKLTDGQLNLPHGTKQKKKKKTRMWANAQRDGRLAEYRWRPVFDATKSG